MDKPKTTKYFIYVFFTLLLAVFAFVIFKAVLPERLFPDNQSLSDKIVIDSLAIAAMDNDSTTAVDSTYITLKKDSTRYEFSADKYMEGHTYIVNFFEQLYALENSKEKNEGLRIAYFGDSMTDGDFIVQDIRREFQQKYGGKGVGFVGITSQSAQSRYSVNHKYSKNWQTISFLKKTNPKKPFGIDGQVSFCHNSEVTTLEYRASDLKSCEQLYNPTLYFGKCADENAYINVYADNDSVRKIGLANSGYLNTVKLASGSSKKIKIEFHASDSIPFYGINFGDKTGVHVDNFSMRGNSGLPLSILSTSLMQKFDQSLQYDLIILQYGANVLGYGTTDYSWYEKKMAIVVEHLKECFPNADILIVSVADKASKVEMEMKTDKAVLPLLNAQKHCAEITGSAFINLYNLMGGEGSMVKWVEEKPTLANKDYTHFNSSGSKKIASLIFNEIEKGYSNYKRLKKFDE